MRTLLKATYLEHSIPLNISTRELVNYAVESVLNEIGFEEGGYFGEYISTENITKIGGRPQTNRKHLMYFPDEFWIEKNDKKCQVVRGKRQIVGIV